ncbi:MULTISPECIES: CDP-alcohol phosphatidyltransferase family protein [Clostridium]|uniref:CDP-alcohol phosphatidyltransferase family protein n=1 Tax=Clostridium cibarium TaxID=2762247 RepID=A0ABR8PVE1_9CLOT|nr:MULTISPECIES: CDP-alcohol phosphatidyltransferase family protein [Clostridium]MBD7912120.1 CDP-alcohol phosphatidyltransferase family protein [Clostridium cibarium]
MKIMGKYIPNSITITRMVLTFIFLYFILEQFQYKKDNIISLIFVFLVICISDLADGKIARRMGTSSVLGAKLDVSADLLYIIISYSALIVVGILPVWFLIFVCFKFIEFTATSKFIKYYNQESKNVFVFDKIGRKVAAIFFIIPGLACISRCMFVDNGLSFVYCILYLTCVAGLYSSIQRVRSCIKLYNISISGN